MRTLAEITKICNKYLDELKARGRKFNPIVFDINKRTSYQNFGMAYCSFRTKGYDVLRVNPAIVNDEDLKNTILHEFAHLDLEAYGDGHGYKWKRVANMYSRWYNTLITRTSRKELDLPPKPSIKLKLVFSERGLQLNPRYIGRPFVKTFTSDKRAVSFANRYIASGIAKGYELYK